MLHALSKPAKIIELHERESRVFSRADLYDSQGQSLILTETRSLSAVELRDVAGGVELRVLGIIGYLPITSDIVLHLTPKFPLKNLWDMLAVADESYERILPILRGYEISALAAPHKLLARSFCYYLKNILTAGIARGYHVSTHEGYYKPKVNFGKTASRFLSRGDEVHVASDIFRFSADLYPNGLLKSACLAFLRVTPNLDKKWASERRLILEALNALYLVTPRRLHVGDEDSSRSLPMWLRDDYQGALAVYSMLLGYSKIGFSYSSTGNSLPSFLFSLDGIFESYIRNYLRQAFFTKKISILDGNSPKHQNPLFTDNKKYPIKPDLIFKHEKATIALGEIKYKPKIDETDRYQLISHVVALNAPIGIWISPAINNDPGLDYIGSIYTGAKFFHYKININNSLPESSLQMFSAILGLVEP